MEAKIKMIVTDLDRSLLKNNKTISEYTKNIFEKCSQKNIIIVFATARAIRETKQFDSIIKPNAIIYLNGSIIMADKNIIDQHCISFEQTQMILSIIKKYIKNVTLSVEINDMLYTDFDINNNLINYKRINFNELPNGKVNKIMFGAESVEEIKNLNQYLPKDIYLEISNGTIILGNIMDKKASKYNGIQTLVTYYKIKTKNIVSFGDDNSDFEMIKKCGIGIAMENSIEEVRKIAKYVCGTNENDGIAHWIEENILK